MGSFRVLGGRSVRSVAGGDGEMGLFASAKLAVSAALRQFPISADEQWKQEPVTVQDDPAVEGSTAAPGNLHWVGRDGTLTVWATPSVSTPSKPHSSPNAASLTAIFDAAEARLPTPTLNSAL